MHAGSSTREQEATAPHPLPLPPHGATPVSVGGAVASSSGVSHSSRAKSRKPAVLATLWLDADHYTYEALCTAGAAAVIVRPSQCEEGESDALHSGEIHAGDMRDRQGLPVDSTATGDDLSMGPRSPPPLRLAQHEGMTAARRRPSSSARASAISAATDGTKRHEACKGGEPKQKASGRTVADDVAHRSSPAASSAGARAAQSTSSGLLPLSPGDADVRLDILEEVELCNVTPILPRTFAVEQLVQQLVPCTYIFAPHAPPPPSATRASSAKRAEADANSPSSAAPAHGFNAPPPRTPLTGQCLAHLRKVSDQHLALLRGATSTPVTPEVVASASAVNGASRTRMVPSTVPVYMQATSLAVCGGSDHDRLTATYTGKGGDGDPHKRGEQESAREWKEEVLLTGGVCQSLLSRLADPSSNESDMEVALAHETDARQAAVEDSAAPLHSEGLPLASNDNAPTLREASESVSSISASVAAGVFSVTATCETFPHCTLSEGSSWRLRGRPAPTPGPQTSSASLTSAAVETAGSCCHTERIAWVSFAAAQARYEQYRQLLLQRHTGGANFPMSPSTGDSASTNSRKVEDRQTRLEEQSAMPDVAQSALSQCTAATSDFTADFETVQKFWTTAAAAPLAPSFMATDMATDPAVSEIGPTDTDLDDANVLALSTALFPLHSSPQLPLPLTLSKQHHMAEQLSLRASQQRQCGAVVEWSSGTVSYTTDTLGLYEEQRVHSQRLYHVLPPSPPSLPLASAVPSKRSVSVARGDGSFSNVAATEDRSSLRGVVLAQLQRLSRLRSAECAAAHGEVALESEDTIEPPARENAVAVTGATRLSPQPPTPVTRKPSPPSSSFSAPTSPNIMPAVALSAHQCRCYRCLPLNVQFAQVPSLTLPVLRRYLDVLHRTALPGLSTQQRRQGTTLASAVEVSAVSSAEEAPELASQREPSSRTAAVARRGGLPAEEVGTGPHASRDGCCGRARAHHSGRRRRCGAVDDVTAANGAKRSKKACEATPVSAPSRPHALQAGGDAQRMRGVDDPLTVFPVLQWWLDRRQEGGRPTHGTPPNGKRTRTETSDAALQSSDGVQRCDRAPSQLVAQMTTGHRHHGEACASGQDRPRTSDSSFPSAVPTEPSSADVVSLDWVDDAVLDEVVVVGIVPRGYPHQLQLVAPSRAFCLILIQRLEEVAEAAVPILGFMIPPHPAPPFPLPGGMNRAPEAAAATATASTSSDTTSEWRAWLEEQYFTAMWTTLRQRLTSIEWRTVLQEACDSPFLARWTKAAAVGSGSKSAVFRDHTLRPGPGLMTTASERGVSGSPAAERHKGEAAVHEALHGMQTSVRRAAELHTTACLSTTEDLVARVILTALVPILHRRITVMYELLRHFASKSLYMSHRMQCDAYQHWYSMTPSPAAVLRLLQRSGRFSRALARCYPQYDLSPVMLSPLTTLDGGGQGGAATRAAAASTSLPSSPLSHAMDEAGNSTAARDVTASESEVTAGSLSTHEDYSPQLEDISATHAETSPARCQARATATVEGRDVESPPSLSSSSSPTTTAAPMAATSAWMSFLPSSSDEPSLQAPPQPPPPPPQQQQAVMTYVPESALLDPRYLQRFAWWMHRVHHGAGTNGSGSATSSGSSGTGGVGVGAPPHSRVASTVHIPGDYLRVLPMQEQDASIRTVLRSLAQKGRTLDLWEMSQHINSHHASYVYH
ncbi:hypothetical_protein (plasmid) [Leishmania braziliensis MHOM/BR/75/M2904]|uniref:Hypothetical_protein n=1 Tax=Leishmania braziliensis MHOM/BR/75/M2904 TaxID=420245 RepID=A0A3P3Z0K4_LEIBR|nr:unnamed protein product [Leishmania braziliensis]SYZ63767.1 hypothetical_protein [Leishmania braziliensis MHOM/BR/75/M2904]